MRKALVVGIDDYPNNSLNGCVNDALRVSHLLETNEDDSPNFEVRTFTQPKDEISKGFLKGQLEKLFEDPAELALFYFSGHGYISSTGGVIVTPDHERNDEGVKMDTIITFANESSARERIIILDCCFSGQVGESLLIGGNHSILSQGVSIITASRGDQPAAEVSGEGVFTSLFCDALEGGASDVIGNIKLANVYAYIDEALGAWDQRPVFKTNVSRFSTIRKSKPYLSLEVLRFLPDYFPNPDYSFDLDFSYEPDATPENEENEKIFRHLQKYRDCRLLEPIGAEHMYYAAMNDEACRLTPLGKQYWRLARDGKI